MSDIFKEIVYLQDFEKDMRRFSKRFRTLNDDLKNFIKTQLQTTHKLKLDNKGVFRIQDTGFDYPKIYKALKPTGEIRKFACQSLFGKGARSGIRVIYAYYEDRDKVEFIQINYKEKQSTVEDRDRIKAVGRRSPQSMGD